MLTVTGAAGGVKYIPKMAEADVREVMAHSYGRTWSN